VNVESHHVKGEPKHPGVPGGPYRPACDAWHAPRRTSEAPRGGHEGLLASGHQVMLGRRDQPERRNRGVNQQPVHGPKPPTMADSGFPN